MLIFLIVRADIIPKNVFFFSLYIHTFIIYKIFFFHFVLYEIDLSQCFVCLCALAEYTKLSRTRSGCGRFCWLAEWDKLYIYHVSVDTVGRSVEMHFQHCSLVSCLEQYVCISSYTHCRLSCLAWDSNVGILCYINGGYGWVQFFFFHGPYDWTNMFCN